MKYAIPKDYSEKQDGSDIRYAQPTEIPQPLPDWAKDVTAFLAKMYGSAEGFVRVPDDTGVHIPPAVMLPTVFDSADWKEYAYGVLGSIAVPTGTTDEKGLAGLRRYGRILKDARASEDDGVVAALDQYRDADNFRKDKVAIFLKMLNDDNKIVSDVEFGAIIGHWPTTARA